MLIKKEKKKPQQTQEQLIKGYFQTISNNTINNLKQTIINKIQSHIMSGKLSISSERQQIINLMPKKVSNPEEQSLEKQKAQKIYKLQVSKYLTAQLKPNSNNKSIQSQSNTSNCKLPILSLQEHKRLMNKIIKNEKHLSSIRKKHQLQQQEARIYKLKTQQKARQIIQQKEKIQKQERLKQKIIEMGEQRQKKREFMKSCNKNLVSVKNKRYLHDKIVDHYQNQVLLPQIIKQKNNLKAIKQAAKKYDISAIMKRNKHSYIENTLNRIKRKTNSMNLLAKQKQIQKNCYDKDQLEIIKIKKQLEQEKKKLENKILMEQYLVQSLKRQLSQSLKIKSKTENRTWFDEQQITQDLSKYAQILEKKLISNSSQMKLN